MLNAEEKAVVELVTEIAPTLPVKKRITIYRGLADLVDDRNLQKIFRSKAEILEEAERRCTELKLFPSNGGQS